MSETRTLKVVVVGNAKSAQAALRTLAGDTDAAGRRMGSTGSMLAGKFAKIGAGAAAGLGLAAGAAATYTYNVGAAYEQSLNKLSALRADTDMSMSQIQAKLAASSSEFSKYGYSVGDAAAGMVELVKAGQSTDKAMKSLSGTLILAKAGQIGVADASSLVANTLNTFKLRASEAGHVANSLANAANISSADVTDLREALAMSGLAAKQAGLNIDQTNAYLAILHNNGMKGSDAGTSLKTMLLRLTSGSKEVNSALKGVGVSVYDSNGNLKDMSRVVKEFLPALDKLSDEKRAKALYAIFGSDSIRSASAIFGEGSKKIDKYMEGVKKAGTAQKFAASGTRGFSGALKRGHAMLESFAQRLYMRVSPALGAVTNKALDAASKLSGKFGPALKNMFKGAGGNGAGGQLTKTFDSLKKFGASLMPTIRKIGSQIMGVLGPAFKDISNMVVNDLLPAFRDFLPVIQPIVKFLLKVFGSAIVGVIKGFVNIVKGAVQIISGVLKIITGVLTGDWSKAWGGLKQLVGGALRAVWGIIQVIWNGGILGVFRKGFTALKSLFTGSWNALKGLVNRGVAGIRTVVNRVFAFLTAPFRRGFAAVKNYVVTGWAYIRGRFSGGIGGIKAVLGRLIEVITWPYRRAFAIAKSVVTDGWSAVRGLFSRGISAVMGIVKSLPGKIKGAFSGAKTWLVNAGKDVIAGIVSGLNSAKKWVIDKVAEITKLIPEKFRKLMGIASPSRVMKGLARWVVAGIAEGLRHAGSLAELDKRLQNIRKRITNAFNGRKISREQKNSLLAVVGREERALRQAVARRLRLAQRLESAQKRLNQLQQRLQTLKDRKQSITEAGRDAAKNGSGIMDMFGGDGESHSVGAILARFQKRLQRIQGFRGNLAKLRSRGLGRDIIEQIIAAGPDDGGAVAQALVNANAGQMSALNSISARIDSEASGIGKAAGATYDAEIKAASAAIPNQQNVVNNIQVQIRGNVLAEKELAKSIADEVEAVIERRKKRNGR